MQMNMSGMPQPQQQQQQQQMMSVQNGAAPANGSSSFYLNPSPEVDDLKRFLIGAPQMWTKPDDPPIRTYQLSTGETISCIYWRSKFFVTGTDIVKILIFRFAQAGRPVLNAKKFEEGIFSDLRNLKPGTEAVLEEPRSDFLDFLFRHGCIRTQKKQKVFFWNCVPHESLFLDAIERDFKREGSLYHMNMMMNHTRYLQKQVAMMQASAYQQQYTGPSVPSSNSHMMMPPPQMMPNNSRNISFSGSSSAANLYPQPGQYNNNASNTVDPFLLNPPMKMSDNKFKINSIMPTMNSAAYIAAPQPNQPFTSMNFSQFDASNELTDQDSLMSTYFNEGDQEDLVNNTNSFIDPSALINLHEY